jgi:hypothetical protein
MSAGRYGIVRCNWERNNSEFVRVHMICMWMNGNSYLDLLPQDLD